MKTIYKALGIAACAVALTSCGDDFLTVTSPTQEDASEYFSTKDHVEEAIVAAYDPMHWTDWSMNNYEPYILMSEVMADDLWVGGSDKNDNQIWHLIANYEATPMKVLTSIWIDGFSGVKRCNDVFSYLSKDVIGASESDIKSWKAQAYVLRAYYANWLWKFYGNVPYFTENLTDPYITPQMTADQVYSHIVSDLEEAIALDVLPWKGNAATYGRITKAMAYMLYAEVVMYQNDKDRYAKALEYMREIIASPDYDLVGDYASIFLESGEWSQESIYEINYISENASRDWGAPLLAGGTVLPTLISPNNWPAGQDGHNTGWGFCPLRLETYERYSANDVRRDATCWDVRAFVGTYNKRYQDFGFFLQKYSALVDGNAGQVASGELNYNNNWRIYRYSETLLNAAELIVLTGGDTAEARNYLNLVRHRAGLETELDPTIDNIIEERHLEFVGEGKRYWDLIRTGKAATVLTPDEYGYRTNAWTPNKKHLPIPQSEIDRAGKTLIQNPY